MASRNGTNMNTGFLNNLSAILLSYSYICGRTLRPRAPTPPHVTLYWGRYKQALQSVGRWPGPSLAFKK